MTKEYILHRNGKEIRIQKEPEVFTAVLTNKKIIEEVNNLSEIKQVKQVFNNVYKIKTTESDVDGYLDHLRTSFETRCVFHHSYNPTGDPATRYYITEMIVVNFKKRTSASKIEEIMGKHGLQFIKEYAGDNKSFLFKVTSSARKNPVKLCNDLMEYEAIQFAEPNLVNRFDKYSPEIDSMFENQWHLKSKKGIELVVGADVNALEAWKITKGSRDVVIAIMDDGFDLFHPDLKGKNKVVHARDFVDGDLHPFPDSEHSDYHGTPCAGVAIGEENGGGIVGIAPGCAFMPVRFDLAADDDLLFEIFDYTGKHADVISCSWGPVPVYAPLGSLLDHKFTELTKSGGPRGKGCLIVFAAGNFNAPVNDATNTDFKWRHPSYGIVKQARAILNGNCTHKDVMAVAASTSQNRKAAYSNWGKEVSVCAPSNNWHPLDPMQKMPGRGIWTTDNENFGLGFTGNSRYTGLFGGTSSATPLVAGIAGLVISANPELTSKEVKKIIEQSTDRIVDNEPDPVLNQSKGTYTNKHSEWFGYGKVNAAKAVKKAYDISPNKKEVAPSPPIPNPKVKAVKEGIFIVAALVNPKGKESGSENISLLNVTDKAIDLNNWKIEIKGKKRQMISDQIIGSNSFLTLKNTVSLSNSGGSIGLFNSDDILVHKVEYSKKDAAKNGWTTVFQ
jgi:subtilisin family serine protease